MLRECYNIFYLQKDFSSNAHKSTLLIKCPRGQAKSVNLAINTKLLSLNMSNE